MIFAHLIGDFVEIVGQGTAVILGQSKLMVRGKKCQRIGLQSVLRDSNPSFYERRSYTCWRQLNIHFWFAIITKRCTTVRDSV